MNLVKQPFTSVQSNVTKDRMFIMHPSIVLKSRQRHHGLSGSGKNPPKYTIRSSSITLMRLFEDFNEQRRIVIIQNWWGHVRCMLTWWDHEVHRGARWRDILRGWSNCKQVSDISSHNFTNTTPLANTPCLEKKLCKIIFVRNSSNFHQLCKFLTIFAIKVANRLKSLKLCEVDSFSTHRTSSVLNLEHLRLTRYRSAFKWTRWSGKSVHLT